MIGRRQERQFFTSAVMAFFVVTSLICMMEGILGMLFMPEAALPYKAFFAPPFFGFCSVLGGLVNYAKKELTVKQVLCRRILHLILVEAMVFGSNYAVGAVFSRIESVALAVSIAVVFILVYGVLYLNDSWHAKQFNRELRKFQGCPQKVS